jgi:putative flippase GtrA
MMELESVTTAGPVHRAGDERRRRRLVEVVVPVYNEERVLADSVRRLYSYLERTFPYPFLITIADNASVDDTLRIAHGLAEELPAVRVVHLDRKGRGRALRQVWSTSAADVVAYMDVDLSTDLDAFLPLIAPLMTGHSDLAIGSRLTRGSAVTRGPKREIISRAYNLLLRTTLAARFTDAQCGFKAARTEIVQALLPAVEDQEWFFDTELLLLAQHNGLRIHEVPVDWTDDPDSRVDVFATARDDLRGMVRVGRRLVAGAFHASVPARRRGTPAPEAPWPRGMKRQLPAFVVIGVLSTIAQLVLYVAFRPAMSPLTANALSLLVTAVANTAANRRFTFGVTGRGRVLRHQLQGGVAFLIGLVLTTAGLGGLHLLVPHASRLTELNALIFCNALAALVRFLLLRAWVFHPRASSQQP